LDRRGFFHKNSIHPLAGGGVFEHLDDEAGDFEDGVHGYLYGSS